MKPYLFVLVCFLIELHWNLKVCCLYLFLFSKWGLPDRGCGLSSGAAYTWTFTVYYSSRPFSWKEKQKFLLYKDIRDFWFVKPDPNMRTMSFYKAILKVFGNIRTNIFCCGWYSYVMFNVIPFFAYGLTSFVCHCWLAILQVFHPKGKKELKRARLRSQQVKSMKTARDFWFENLIYFWGHWLYIKRFLIFLNIQTLSVGVNKCLVVLYSM